MTGQAMTTTCPHCSVEHELVTALLPGPPVMPWPGATAVCWSCGSVSIYDETLQLRLPLPAELEEAEADPDVRLTQQRARAAQLRKRS